MSFHCSEPVNEELESDAQIDPCPHPALDSPPVLTDPPEQKETQLAVAEDKITQTTLSVSDNEMQTFHSVSEEHPPEASSTTEPEPKPDVKQEYEDVAVTTEEDKCEIRPLEETQACQTSSESAGAQLNELHEPEESFQPCPRWSPVFLRRVFQLCAEPDYTELSYKTQHQQKGSALYRSRRTSIRPTLL